MRSLFTTMLLFAALHCSLFAQQRDTVTLEQCYRQAMQNFPLAKQKAILQQATDLEVKKINTQYMPQLSVNAQAIYYSDVPEVPVENPLVKIPTVPKDQYKATVDLNQTIYDGGVAKNQKAIESSSLLAEQQNIEVELYNLKTQVASLFFSALLADAQLELNELLVSSIESELEKVRAAVENGVSIESNQNVLEAELISARQQRDAFIQNKLAAIAMLAELTGLALDTSNIFQLPVSDFMPSADFSTRPEYQLFQLQKQTLETQQNAIISKQLPRFSAFAQGGIGRPGYNVLDPDFAPMYNLGLRMSWSPWHWNAEKFERQIIAINSNIIGTQQEAFDINTRIAMLQIEASIKILQQKIVSDKEIIKLREKITVSASAQLENGVITSTDYITELNAEHQAKLNLSVHLIQLEQAKAEYLLITGK